MADEDLLLSLIVALDYDQAQVDALLAKMFPHLVKGSEKLGEAQAKGQAKGFADNFKVITEVMERPFRASRARMGKLGEEDGKARAQGEAKGYTAAQQALLNKQEAELRKAENRQNASYATRAANRARDTIKQIYELGRITQAEKAEQDKRARTHETRNAKALNADLTTNMGIRERAKQTTDALNKQGQIRVQNNAKNNALIVQAQKATDTAIRQSTARANQAADRANARRNTIQRQGTTLGQIGVDDNRVVGQTTLAEQRRIQTQIASQSRAADAQAVADIKRRNALIISAEQQAGVRRTALIRTILNNLTRANQTGMTLIVNAWRSHQAKVLETQRSGNRREESELTASLSRRETRLRASLNQQAAIQARGTASDRANQVASTGVLGLATGRSSAAMLGGGIGGGMMLRRGFNVLADFQQIEVAFKGIFREIEGGAPRTTAFLKEMQEFAKETPFSLREVADSAQKLFTNRIVDSGAPDAIDQVKDKLRILADAASATGKSAEQMNMGLLGITQIGSSGQFMMEELRQITENIGLPMEEVAKALGITVAQMRKDMKAGAITAEDGLNAVFKAMQNIPGAAGASARQAKTLRGSFAALNDVIDQFILRIGKGIGERVAALVNLFNGFASALMDGTGAWKVARDAIGGIAKVLGVLLAAAGGVKVLQLIAIGLGAIAASPVALAVTGIAALAGGLTALYKNNDKVKSFFDELVRGTRNWFEVGFLIKEPITEFSKFVLLQSSLGAAFRVVRDGFRGVQDAVMVLIRTRSLDAFMDSLSVTRESLRGRFDPIRDALVDGFGGAFSSALATLKQSRTNVGTFLAALMTVSGVGGPISRMLTRSISGIFGVAVKDADMDSPAADMALRVRDSWDRAFATARDIQTVVADFFRSAFKGLDSGTAVAGLGLALRETVIGAIERLGDVSERVASVIGDIGGAIGSKLTAALVPWVIELPRTVGRFLSETAFSEEFIKVFGGLALALAGTAVVIALQFARGFVEGLWNRRGDIAKVFQDIFAFIFSGSWLGDIGARLAQALLVGFVAAKAWGGLNAAASPFRKFAIGMTNDLAGARAGLLDLSKKAEGTGSKAADLGQKFGRFGDLAHKGIRGTRDMVAGLGARLEQAGAGMRGVSGVFVNSTGQMVQAGSSMSRATVTSVSRMSDTLGRFTMYAGGVLQRAAGHMQQVGTAATRMGRTVQGAFQRAGGSTGIMRGAMSALAGGMSGYFAGIADDAVSMGAALTGVAGSIAAGFAMGGPIGSALAAVASGAGILFGLISKKSSEMKRQMEEARAAAGKVADSFLGSFNTLGATGPLGRQTAALEYFNSQVEAGEVDVTAFKDTFDSSFKDVANAVGGGTESLNEFYDNLVSRDLANVLKGDVDAITRHRAAFDASIDTATEWARSYDTELNRERLGFSPDLQKNLGDLDSKLRSDKISVADYGEELRKLGYTESEVTFITKQLRDQLEAGIDASGAGFIASLGSGMDEAIERFTAMQEVNDELKRRLEATLPAADRFSAAFERVKDRLDRAKNAYRSYIDEITGKQSDANTAITDIFAAARSGTEAQGEGESNAELMARRSQAAIDAQLALDAVIARSARESGGNFDKLKGDVDGFIQSLIDGTDDQTLKDFFEGLRGGVSDEALRRALNTEPAVKNLTDFKERYSDFLLEIRNNPLLVNVKEADGSEERRNAIFAALVELEKSDPTVTTFIKENGDYAGVIAKIEADSAFIEGLNPQMTVRVGLGIVEGAKERMLNTLGILTGGLFNFGQGGGEGTDGPTIPIRPALADGAGPSLQRELDDIIANNPLKITVEAELTGPPGWRNQPQGIRGANDGEGGGGSDGEWKTLPDGTLYRIETEQTRVQDKLDEAKRLIEKFQDEVRRQLGLSEADWYEILLGNTSVGGAVGGPTGAFTALGNGLRTSVSQSVNEGLDAALMQERTVDVNVRVRASQIADNLFGTFKGLIPGFYKGGVVDSPTIAAIGERGSEAIFPLTNPTRMRELMGIPQVASAFESAGIGGRGPQEVAKYAPVTVDQSQVNTYEIHESSPRLTADEIFRRNRKARFHGGHTLPVVVR